MTQIDLAKLAELEAALTNDTVTDDELAAALHAAGLPEVARVLRRALAPADLDPSAWLPITEQIPSGIVPGLTADKARLSEVRKTEPDPGPIGATGPESGNAATESDTPVSDDRASDYQAAGADLPVPPDARAMWEMLTAYHFPNYPPTHPRAGSNPERAYVGDPGHCEVCAVLGHERAHPDYGCGDVGCTKAHPAPIPPEPWISTHHDTPCRPETGSHTWGGTMTGGTRCRCGQFEISAAGMPVPVCMKCNGEGLVADTDNQEPWSAWANLPPGSDLAVRTGMVRPIPCPNSQAHTGASDDLAGTDREYERRKSVYDERIARWASRLAAATLTAEQADGHACVACGRNHLTDPAAGPSVPIGFGPRGQVFVCVSCDQPGDAGDLKRNLLAAQRELLATLGQRIELESEEQPAGLCDTLYGAGCVCTESAGHPPPHHCECGEEWTDTDTSARPAPTGDTGFTCPRCGRTSWHPADLRYGYCGNCHAYTAASAPPAAPLRVHDPGCTCGSAGRWHEPGCPARPAYTAYGPIFPKGSITECDRAAVYAVEGYSPPGSIHGSLDVVLYACEEHEIRARGEVQAAGFAPHSALQPEPDTSPPPRCGDSFRYGALTKTKENDS